MALIYQFIFSFFFSFGLTQKKQPGAAISCTPTKTNNKCKKGKS
jgi:hypothetical protein